MQKMLRWISTVALVVAGGTVVTTSPASAASCPSAGSSCTGWDPQSTGCSSSGASTLESFYHGGSGKVELRYSSGCHAAWTRFTSTDDKGGKISIESDDGIEYQVNLAGYTGEVKWTRMIDFSKRVRACHFAYYGGQALWACSGWH